MQTTDRMGRELLRNIFLLCDLFHIIILELRKICWNMLEIYDLRDSKLFF